MQKIKFTVLWLFSTLAMVMPAKAAEIYSVVTDSCRLSQGMIIGTTETHLQMLGLDGRDSMIPEKSVELIVMHNTVENPFSQWVLGPSVQQRLKKVYTTDSKKPQLIGWPIKFIEDLVVFYDLEGQSHVLDLFSITKIRPVESFSKKAVRVKHKDYKLGLGEGLTRCERLHRNGLRPTRVLADKIRIGEFLNTLRKGYHRIESYEERTYFYAKPMLFDNHNRFGFTFYGDHHEIPPTEIPAYFQWSSGQPYRFQSQSTFGYDFVRLAPSAEPLFAFQSELKSHLFHGAFIGNLGALSAGTEYFTPNRSAFADFNKDLVKTPLNFSRSGASFNYLALMGLDYGPYSFSYGTGFIIYGFEVGDEFREVLASSVSPVLRFRLIKPQWESYVVLSWTKRDIDQGVTDLKLSRAKDESVVGFVDGFEFNGSYIRGGLDYFFSDDISFGGEMLLVQGDYEERLAGSGLSNTMNFTNQTLSAFVSHSFGDYISLGIRSNMISNQQKYTFSSQSNSRTQDYSEIGGFFEFIF